MQVVWECVLLNKSLYWENNFCKYFIDFVAKSLVSWKAIRAGFGEHCVMNLCKLERVVLRELTFHVINCVVWWNWGFCCSSGVGIIGAFCGFVYSGRGSKQQRAFWISEWERYRNCLWSVRGIGGAECWWMKAYNLSCIEWEGVMMSLWVVWKRSRGWRVVICLSKELGRCSSCASKICAHEGFGCVWRFYYNH